VGIGKPDDMKNTASWLKTDAVIMTAIGETPAHIEFFNSYKHLVDEKSQLIKTLKSDGLLVLNADDEVVLGMKIKDKHRLITYGFSNEANIVASGDAILYNEKKEPEGVIFRIDEEGNSMPVTIEGVFGRNHVYASLAALALSSGLKFNKVTAINSLKNYDVPPGRMRLLHGIKDTYIIDDTYNSSPLACETALKTMREVVSEGRKIAVLGDMLELGKHTVEAHKNIGKITKENVDILIAVGPRAKSIKEGAIESGMKNENIFDFSNSIEAGDFIKSFIEKNDVVLIKGSQGMRMERVVETILLDQENKEKLLVRQDDDWKRKK
jgi:UDP-N-acetylmuramoyl-tripeptide--D-alanyl-D-alanine ligase